LIYLYFGLVQDLEDAESDGRLTEVGLIMGTPAYMSPEQASAARPSTPVATSTASGAWDFALTGRPVFEGHSIGQLIASHLTQTPPQLTGLRSDVPLDLAAVVHRCLAKDPADRFANVSELERALGHCGCAADWSEDAAACWWQSTIEVEDAPELSL
jgi:eukaryotic-like serine/threonine-protein kinase